MSAVPKLRFPSNPIHNFPDWAPLNLYEVASFFSGGTPKSTDQAYYGGQIPFIKSGEIKSITTSQTLSELGLKSSSAKKVSRGDLLYALYGATSGEVAISKIDGAINQAVLCIRTQLDTYFLYSWLLREKQNILDTYLQGGQGNLSAQIVKNFKIFAPSLPEQQKIASFLSSVDKKIDLLRQKKDALELYKKGLMQKLFSQEIRFKQDDGSDFPDWEEVALGDVLHEHKEKSAGQEPVFSVSVSKGLVDQIEHLGRSFSAADTGHYNKAKPHDVIYTKSPTGNFPLGIIKQSTVGFDVIVSPLYGVFTPETPALGFILNAYFESEINVGNYLSPLVQKGAKNTIACTNKRFLEGRLRLPRSHDEQRKIAGFLAVIQKKIAVTSSQIEQMETFKKGLLQQMFV